MLNYEFIHSYDLIMNGLKSTSFINNELYINFLSIKT